MNEDKIYNDFMNKISELGSNLKFTKLSENNNKELYEYFENTDSEEYKIEDV